MLPDTIQKEYAAIRQISDFIHQNPELGFKEFKAAAALKKFLSIMEDKFVSQQDKISSLETKLEEVVSLVDNKDTAQLTKKVGGMDKQLAKLNKSIEKIASNVVEK